MTHPLPTHHHQPQNHHPHIIEFGTHGPRPLPPPAWGERAADALPTGLKPVVAWVERAARRTAGLRRRLAGTWRLDPGTDPAAWRREHAAIRAQLADLVAALSFWSVYVADALPRRLAQDAYARRLAALNRRLARAAAAAGAGTGARVGPKR